MLGGSVVFQCRLRSRPGSMVGRHGERALSVRAPGGGMHQAIMPAKDDWIAGAVCAPDTCCLVVGGNEQASSVGAPGHGRYCAVLQSSFADTTDRVRRWSGN